MVQSSDLPEENLESCSLPGTEKLASRMRLVLLNIIAGILSVVVILLLMQKCVPSTAKVVIRGGGQQNDGVIETTLLPDERSTALGALPFEAVAARAEIERAAGNTQQALELYELVLSLEPNAEVLRDLFDLSVILGNKEKAEYVLGLLSFQNVPESSLEALRAFLLLREGDVEGAKQIFITREQDPEYRFGLLVTSILEEQHEPAVLLIEELLQSGDPNIVQSTETILGAYDEFALFEEGKGAHLDTLLARALGQIGQWPAAALLLEGVHAKEENYRDAYILEGYTRLMLGEKEAALSSLEKAYEIDPEKAETQYFLGLVHESVGSDEKALTFLNNALVNGFTPRKAVREKLADIAQKRSDFDAVISQYRSLIQEGEADGKTFRDLALLVYRQTNDVDKVASIAEQAKIAFSESNPDVLHLIGWAALLKKDFNTAAIYLTTAVTQDPTHAYAWFHKAMLSEQLEDAAEAIASYRKAYEYSIVSDEILAIEAARKHNALLVSEGSVIQIDEGEEEGENQVEVDNS